MLAYLVVLLSSLAVRIDVDHDPAEVRQVGFGKSSARGRACVVAQPAPCDSATRRIQ
jgi:hypothetical protein